MFLDLDSLSKKSGLLLSKSFIPGSTLEKDKIYFTIKEAIAVEGYRHTASSKVLKNNVAIYSSRIYSEMIRENYLFLGQTLQDEFGIGHCGAQQETYSLLHPEDPALNAGGSSTGAGLTTYFFSDFSIINVCTTTGGSITLRSRLLKLYCFIPSYNKISRQGLIDYSMSMDKIGFMCTKKHLLLDLVSKYCEERESEDFIVKIMNPTELRLENLSFETSSVFLSSSIKDKISILYDKLTCVEFYGGFQKYVVKNENAISLLMERARKKYFAGEKLILKDKQIHLSLLKEREDLEKELLKILFNSENEILLLLLPQCDLLNKDKEPDHYVYDSIGNFLRNMETLQGRFIKNGYSYTILSPKKFCKKIISLLI